MNKLRLGPLPKTELVKVTISLTSRLKTELDQYAAMHSEAHGETVDAIAIVPHMLETFIAKDRSFQRAKKGRAR